MWVVTVKCMRICANANLNTLSKSVGDHPCPHLLNAPKRLHPSSSELVCTLTVTPHKKKKMQLILRIFCIAFRIFLLEFENEHS